MVLNISLSMIDNKSVVDYFRKRNAGIFKVSLIQKEQTFIFFAVGFIGLDTIIIQQPENTGRKLIKVYQSLVVDIWESLGYVL